MHDDGVQPSLAHHASPKMSFLGVNFTSVAAATNEHRLKFHVLSPNLEIQVGAMPIYKVANDRLMIHLTACPVRPAIYERVLVGASDEIGQAGRDFDVGTVLY